jgi:hypothetical protein
MKKRSKAEVVIEEDDDEVVIDVIDDEGDDFVAGDVEEDEEYDVGVPVDYGEDDDVFEEDVPIPKNAKKAFERSKRKASNVGGMDLGGADEDDLFPLGDYSSIALLPDHERRPLWVTEDGHLFLEMFHPAKVYDFVITIAEPIFRPLLIHE